MVLLYYVGIMIKITYKWLVIIAVISGIGAWYGYQSAHESGYEEGSSAGEIVDSHYEGYQKGYEDGHDQGREEGFKAGLDVKGKKEYPDLPPDYIADPTGKLRMYRDDPNWDDFVPNVPGFEVRDDEVEKYRGY